MFRARSVDGGHSFRPNQRVTSSGRGHDFVLAWGDFRRIISTPRGNRPDQDVFFTLIKP